jgi:hypothetical protein
MLQKSSGQIITEISANGDFISRLEGLPPLTFQCGFFCALLLKNGSADAVHKKRLTARVC